MKIIVFYLKDNQKTGAVSKTSYVCNLFNKWWL